MRRVIVGCLAAQAVLSCGCGMWRGSHHTASVNRRNAAGDYQQPPLVRAPARKDLASARPIDPFAGYTKPPGEMEFQPLDDENPPTGQRAGKSRRVAWKTLARSVQGRAIQYAQFGPAGRTGNPPGDGESLHSVLVLGPLHGDQTPAMAMAEGLAACFHRFSHRIDRTAVTVVRTANPDGRAARTAANARGVDLDRNFQTESPADAEPAGGVEPDGRDGEKRMRSAFECEPETEAIANLIDHLRPQRIVLLRSTSKTASIAYAGGAGEVAKKVSFTSRLRPAKMAKAAAAGSLVSYAAHGRRIPTVIINVPRGKRPMENWSALRPAMLLAAGLPGVDEADKAPGAGEQDASVGIPLRDPPPKPRQQEVPADDDAGNRYTEEPQEVIKASVSGAAAQHRPSSVEATSKPKTPATDAPAVQPVPASGTSGELKPMRPLPPVDEPRAGIKEAAPPGEAFEHSLPQAPIPFYPRTGP